MDRGKTRDGVLLFLFGNKADIKKKSGDIPPREGFYFLSAAACTTLSPTFTSALISSGKNIIITSLDIQGKS